MRIGQGYDIHPLVAGRRLVLGGVEIPSDVGLEGHSDADVLVHAIMDALLGALALGDIGQHFPNTDERYRDVDSIRLLERVAELIRQHGARVVNVDSTVVAER
ncbi:MAG TPA: 2-C-methyl-D-erythritol 2,4-cyclodiphosphate synthase, partial [Candidatus Latescibacteria bacterium]|nr:2-C-methyl-D-erythritol 2,4-cyclodiphosphate synthase [Candidatus Latescibacterota bacterium]